MTYPATFRCPTRDEIVNVLVALLPRGRAWQTHEGGPLPGIDVGFHPGGFNDDAFATDYRPPSILLMFWRSVADVSLFVHQRLCALRLEFWCKTASETRDQWLTEYGLPDLCDPFPDLCTKVAAIGGTRCEYYAYIAARAGWSLTCVEMINSCGARAGGRNALAGRMRSGRKRGALVKIVVDIGQSPAFTGIRRARPMAGRMRSGAGRRLSCGPDLGPLECLLARVVHAEILISYEVTNV